MDLTFVDCNCIIGRRADRRPTEPWSVEQLLGDMSYYGIREALVTHAQSRDYDPRTGNMELIRQLANNPMLHPCWAVLPPASQEIPPAKEFVDEMMANGVASAVAYPHTHNFSLSHWSVGSLLTSLQDRRIPLMLPFNQTTWDEVERICRTFPELPCIITDVNYRQLRFLLPLWETLTNLFVDLSWFSVHDGLAFLAEQGHLGQLLFGTHYPVYQPSAAVTMVTYANIPSAQKKQVAGATLSELIRNIRRTL